VLFVAFAALGYPGAPIGAYRSLFPLRGFAALLPVICSLGAWTCLDHGPFAAAVASSVASLLAATVLIPLDRLWLRLLARAARAVV
jgi:hypothetical protein